MEESGEYADMVRKYVKESNRYELGEVLGEGGYGKVYKATDKISGDYVAVKIIDDMTRPLSEEAEYRYYEQIKKETVMKLNNRLSSGGTGEREGIPMCHRNVVCYYNVFEEEGKVYVVMEYVEGTDLLDYMVAYQDFGSDIPIEKIVDILKQITKGLIHLHSIGVIHRDLKPENVMIDGDGTIKITDYGLSCFKDIYRSCSGSVGTPSYVSPQIIDEELMMDADDELLKKIYKANDVWSMGVIGYILANQVMPFNGDYGGEEYDIEGTLNSILYDIPISEYEGSTSLIYSDRWLNELIESLLTKNYMMRPTLEEVDMDLGIDRQYYYKNIAYDRVNWLKMLRELGYEVDEETRTEELMSFMDRELLCNINKNMLSSEELLFISKIMGIKYNMLTMGGACQQLREIYNTRYRDYKRMVDQTIIKFVEMASAKEMEEYILMMSKLDKSVVDVKNIDEYIRIVSNTKVNDAYNKYNKLKMLRSMIMV